MKNPEQQFSVNIISNFLWQLSKELNFRSNGLVAQAETTYLVRVIERPRFPSTHPHPHPLLSPFISNRCWCVSLFLALLAIVWLGVPLLPPLFVGSVIAPSGCPAHPASCLFSASYDAARTRFRAACTAHPRCTLTTVPLPRTAGSEAPLSDDLTIDFARVAGARATPTGPLLVHVSATHGAEGHAGSAVQLAALRRLAATADAGGDADDADAETTILFVHALNPFGMKYGRRFNERNVDLNRNALFPSVPTFRGAFARLAADPAHVDAYTRVAPVLNDATGWRAPLRANVLFFTRLAGALLNPLGVGFVGLKRCLVAGQYHARDGLYYGGAELEASHAVLIAKLRAEYALHRSVIFLDVHSGLGPPGVDTLLLPAAHNSASSSRDSEGEGEERGEGCVVSSQCPGALSRVCVCSLRTSLTRFALSPLFAPLAGPHSARAGRVGKPRRHSRRKPR